MFLLILFLFTCAILFSWKDARKPKGFPPGPSWLPFIGSVLHLREILKRNKFYHLAWQELSNRYGPVVGLRVGSGRVAIVSGRDTIKEIYSSDRFDGRPDGFFFKIRSFDKRLGIVFVDGCLWEKQRTFTAKVFKQLGMGKSGMIDIVEREAREMIEHFMECSHRMESIDMHNAFDISVLNTMWTLLAGNRFHLEDERLPNLMRMIHESFRIIDMSGGILNEYPFLRYILPDKSGYRPLVNRLKPLWKFLKETINEMKDGYNTEDDHPKSLIDAFLSEMKKNVNNPQSIFTDEQLLSLCLDLFQAGSETTSNTLGFGIIYMLHHPDVQKKVQNELESVVGRNRFPSIVDRTKLCYTEATICEIQRLSNVAPLAIAHRAIETAKLGDYIVPKDTITIISLYSMHMDEKYWKDPHEFRPERFLDEQGHLIQHDYFLPFGSGKRRCVGENLAKSSLFLFFATFIHSFNFEIPSGQPLPDTEGLDGITLSPKPYKVILKIRQ